jgi:hypothetical protein
LWLHAAGGGDRPSSTSAGSILINGKWLGETAAELMVSRLVRPTRPPLRVGVPMVLELGSSALDIERTPSKAVTPVTAVPAIESR